MLRRKVKLKLETQPLMKLRYIALSLLVFVTCVASAQSQTDYSFVDVPSWSDEFNYKGYPDSAKWIITQLKQPDHDAYYVKNKKNCYVKKGCLNLTLTNTPKGKSRYESGRVYTRRGIGFRYGKLVIRAKCSTVHGAWEALWLKPVDGTKAACKGEIDLMEYFGGWSGKQFQINFHLWGEFNNKKNNHAQYPKFPPIDISKWHTYTMERVPDHIRCFVDGHLYYDIKKGDIPAWPFNDMDYMLTLAFGYGYKDAKVRDDNKLPQTLKVDYVRFYKMK